MQPAGWKCPVDLRWWGALAIQTSSTEVGLADFSMRDFALWRCNIWISWEYRGDNNWYVFWVYQKLEYTSIYLILMGNRMIMHWLAWGKQFSDKPTKTTYRYLRHVAEEPRRNVTLVLGNAFKLFLPAIDSIATLWCNGQDWPGIARFLCPVFCPGLCWHLGDRSDETSLQVGPYDRNETNHYAREIILQIHVSSYFIIFHLCQSKGRGLSVCQIQRRTMQDRHLRLGYTSGSTWSITRETCSRSANHVENQWDFAWSLPKLSGRIGRISRAKH